MTARAQLPHTSTLPDLAPEPGAEIEWWYVQGWVEGSSVGRLHVMASVFRMRPPGATGPTGAMLIQQVFHPETGAIHIDSRVTPEAMAVHGAVAGRVAASFPPPLRALALRRHLGDTARAVRQGEVTIDPDGPEIDIAPFRVRWNGFSLRRDGDVSHCTFSLPGGQSLSVAFEPETPWLDTRSHSLHSGLGDVFGYVTCPRLRAVGTLGGRPVTGRFWIDRQWGDYRGWMLDARGGGLAVLGWDWFGLNLDDGRDLLVFRHHDPARRQARQSWGVVFGDGAPRASGPVEARALRHWTSPRTGGVYPVAWELSLPASGLRLAVEPLLADQEIPVYGTRAIWEGTVAVEGRAGSEPLRGSGRLELVGYGAPLTVRDRLGRSLAGLARRIGLAAPGGLR